MYSPTFTEFKKKAKVGNLIPVYKEIIADTETPVSAFLKLSNGVGGKYAYLLESVEGGEKTARYSFLGSNPSVILKSKNRTIEIIRNSKKEKFGISKDLDPLDVLKKEISKFKLVESKDLPPFIGGAVGYISYDMVRFFEKLPDMTTEGFSIPDSVFVFTDTILIFDHIKHTIKVVSNAYVEGNTKRAYKDAICKIENIIAKLKTKIDDKFALNHKTNIKKINFKSNFSKKEYKKIVEKAKEYIKAGDIIQVVPSQRFEVPIKNENSFNVYRALRIVNPSPYMYYLKFDGFNIIGASPELLVRVEGNKVISRPIAGTRPRGKTPEKDVDLWNELKNDPKEIAEHVMLVDLARNDIGRVCKYGTVVVDEFMQQEKYSFVMHIVSNVSGTLLPSKDQFDVLRATFPAGTVSGAPKIRAMEIIEELESVKRRTYAGAIGYFSFSGNLDTCITIRTIIVHKDKAYIQAGGGIVADSVPDKEYQETINKAKALLKAIEIAERG
jgi:anthranilate synthase component 1